MNSKTECQSVTPAEPSPAVVIVHSETEIETHIDAQAQESTRQLLDMGWGLDSPCLYQLLSGDTEALSERLGRETTREERLSLETAIRLYLIR